MTTGVLVLSVVPLGHVEGILFRVPLQLLLLLLSHKLLLHLFQLQEHLCHILRLHHPLLVLQDPSPVQSTQRYAILSYSDFQKK